MKKSLLIGFGLMIACSVIAQKPIVSAKKLKKKNYQVLPEPRLEDEKMKKLDAQPMYPNGIDGLLDDFYSAVIYPFDARIDGVEGMVVVSFVIERDGSISELEITQSLREDIDQECLRVIKKLKPFYPGFAESRAVRVQFNLPVKFALN